ncbi:alpha-2-macroglobulin [Stappia sp. F7233]|uniref:Alpha-2-macroglobulin n=1 Tax=Stappia albiluteola TaxID=2758565 RepID=A0A839AGA2_9HYPH|nr:alpha-2-macroglobulin family protein [Stappia albiluteola]MBA5778068.1 alpha-2-macroglobulin [Stappia albiluteola]
MLKPTIFATVIAGAAILFGATLPGAVQAQERRIVTVEDADYFGADFETLKDVDLEACKASCLDNRMCRAFTYNVQARWCFLKSDIGNLQSFAGAVAGRVVEIEAAASVSLDQREQELAFVSQPFRDEAKRLSRQLPRLFNPGGETLASLRQQGYGALGQSLNSEAQRAFSQALVLAPEDYDLWRGLTFSLLRQEPSDWQLREEVYELGTSAAQNAYLRSRASAEQAEALDLLGSALSRRQAWKPVIKAWRQALALDERPGLRERLQRMVDEHGFRILDHQVDSDAANPRICVVFSDDLPRNSDMSAFVRVTGEGAVAVEAEGSQVCVDGVRHGARYSLLIRSGLPAADGETLERTAELNVYVRDRTPSVRFLGRAYVLPAGKDATIPIVSVNTGEVETEIYRIGDRALASALRDRKFLVQLDGYTAGQVREDYGEAVWKGVVETRSELNTDVTTAIPLDDIGLEKKPGIYAMTARARNDKASQWGPWATQWFLVSDLGLATYSGSDGITASVRSLASAGAVEGANIRLVAVNNEILGAARTDAQGFARFAPGLARGRGGQAPALLVAETEVGDYAFLDLGKPAFDLSDRGVEGRPAAGPIDIFAWTERGVYRPGETVHASALARDGKADALGGLPLTFVFERPDGVEHARMQVADEGLGGRSHALHLPAAIQQGAWTLKVYADPKGQPVAEKSFLVEDFQPERVDFDLETDVQALDPLNLPQIAIDARFLYGAPAAGQRLEGEVIVSPSHESDAYPGYRFGLEDEETYASRAAIEDGNATDGDGRLTFVPPLPQLADTTGLRNAEIVARLVEAGGRFVERRITLPILSDGPRIGIKPAFEDGVEEGGPAEFDVIAIGADGARVAADGLAWTLLKVDRRFQWYRVDGRWNYEPVTTTRRVANGTLDVAPGEPSRLSLPVEWGGYRLEIVRDGADSMATSISFNAGWYVSSASSETPDFLDAGLDKPRYRVGETALLRLKPRFDGTAVVNVLSDRLIATKVVEVTGDSAEVPLEVTEEWGAGAYVTAALYRPMDIEANRMPARAIGLQWLGVDPQDRALEVSLDAPERILPQTTLDVGIRIANLSAGEEAYLALAAVDVGILNLTGYRAPDPEAWYFGQRRLGMDLRDLYGQLIDRTAGERGRVRSGGDGVGLRPGAPPPQEAPLALFSGIVAVDDNGEAQVSFDIPDFNGTVKLMAVAWSARGVGNAERDVISRSPVVLSASLPRFLAPGDRSRLLVEIDNVDGPAGDYSVSASVTGPLLVDDGRTSRSLALDAKARDTLRLPIVAGSEEGDSELVVTVEGPDGIRAEKHLALGIRDTQPDVTRRSYVSLAPNGSLTLDADALAGLKPASASVSLSAGNAARINIAGLLDQLDRYPYGCTEQLTSRALPLLYLNEVAVSAGLATDAAIRERVESAIVSVLANQSSNGSFGLWSSFGDSDTWLDAYVTDFLLRARERGYAVAEVALSSALDNLENRIAYASDFREGGEGIAYALYVLARSGRASIGDLRYYADQKLADFATPLAKGQVGASLALYGETGRAERAFETAVVDLEAGHSPQSRDDYGTPLRDGAGLLGYLSAARLPAVSPASLARYVAARQETRQALSTQDMAWLLLAAHELQADAGALDFAVDGTPLGGALTRRFAGANLAASPVRVENRGTAPGDALITVTGKPLEPEPAGGEGFTIEREVFDLDGNRIDAGTVAQNARLVVVVTVTADLDANGRLLVVDRLPGGITIDNPRLVRAGDLGGLDWLDPLSEVEHAEFRDDRFAVAIDQRRVSGDRYTFAYLARASTPGTYAHPPATVEDMYRPERAARTASGTFEIVGPDR